MWITRTQYDTMMGNLERARQQIVDLTMAVSRAHQSETSLLVRLTKSEEARDREHAHHDDLSEVLPQVQGRSLEQAARIAGLEAHLGWLAAHVNRLEVERTQLLARLDVRVPTPTVEYQPEPMGRSMPLDETVVPEPPPGTSIEAALHGGLTFEDVGDEMAGRLGLRRAPDGSLL